MKTFMFLLSLFSLLTFQVACNRDVPEEEIQEEEHVLGVDDIRETERRDAPIQKDEEVEVDRDVLGDDEVEIND